MHERLVPNVLERIPSNEVLKSIGSTGSCTCVVVRFNPEGSVWLLDAQERQTVDGREIVTGVGTKLEPEIYDAFINDALTGAIFEDPTQDTLRAQELQGSSMMYVDLQVLRGTIHPFKVLGGTVDVLHAPLTDLKQSQWTDLSTSLGGLDAGSTKRPANALQYNAVEWQYFIDSVRNGGFMRPLLAEATQIHPAMTPGYPALEAA